MAQTKRKRRRKHRGTQSGRVDSRPRGRPRNRAEARARAQSRSSRSRRQPGATPPTWRGAIVKGSIAALLFFVLIGFAFGRPVGASAALAGVMLLFYVPMSYYTDRFFHRRRLRQGERERQERAQRPADED